MGSRETKALLPLLLLLLLVLAAALAGGCAVVSSGQPIEPETAGIGWEQAFGGAARDSGHAVEQTADGGYIVAGQTFSFGDRPGSVYLVKTGPDGSLRWEKSFGGSGRTGAHAVRQAADGGYIVTGQTWPGGGGASDLYLLKVSAEGDLEWERAFGGAGNEGGQHVAVDAGGGFIACGWTESAGPGRAIYLVKVDASGRLEWERALGHGQWSVGQHVLPVADGFVVTGWTEPGGGGGRNAFLAKVDRAGNPQWEYACGEDDDVIGQFTRQDEDGGLIMAGQVFSYATGTSSVYLVKVDSGGQKQWEKTVGGGDGYLGLSVHPSLDGGYLVLGQVISPAGYRSIALAAFEESGKKKWVLYWGGQKDDAGLHAIETADGGYVVAGWTESLGAGDKDVYLVKLMP